MNTLAYDQAQLQPLITDADIEARVSDLVGRAHSRQLWLMFLDEGQVQLPFLFPIEELPSAPTPEHVERVIALIDGVLKQLGATSMITVLERYASASLTAQDAEWFRSLRNECSRQGVSLRAQLLSHRSGVRLVAESALSGS